jgi:hypothetical protein
VRSRPARVPLLNALLRSHRRDIVRRVSWFPFATHAQSAHAGGWGLPGAADLVATPLEMVNGSGDVRYAEIQATLLGELQSLCDPEPPGYVF